MANVSKLWQAPVLNALACWDFFLVVNCGNHKPNNLKHSRYCHIEHLYCSYEIKDSNRNKIALKCKHRFYWQRLKFCSFNNRTFHFRLRTRPEKWSNPITDFSSPWQPFQFHAQLKLQYHFVRKKKKNCTTGRYSFFLEGTGEIKLILIREAEL